MVGDEVVAAWVAGLDDLFARVAGRFFRAEPRRRARAYVRGLLAPIAGKNGWTLAEAAGEATPEVPAAEPPSGNGAEPEVAELAESGASEADVEAAEEGTSGEGESKPKKKTRRGSRGGRNRRRKRPTTAEDTGAGDGAEPTASDAGVADETVPTVAATEEHG